MNPNLLRNLSFHARRLRLPPTPSLLSLFSSRTNPPPLSHHTHNKRDPLVEDISNEELMRRVAKLQEDGADAIPSMFEAILQRYLTGNPIEADKELMREILGKGTESEDDEDDELDSDLEGIDDETDEEDFDLGFSRRNEADGGKTKR
ncbi:uncharacterized protein LOC113867305 [Abrus precatorius]|uniref:Uncharacterized protein LOC113867305 n=1 Tax=Abrus precatorius TaxID=3816 RepID=A0A8B8LPP5_ABRPR|nr:uncharacterized protein LOC113867305 [Abrus precatorius]